MKFQDDYDSLTQELKLGTLHQIVMGLSNIDLASQLSHSSAEIDTPCAQGRTPLFWAATRSDINAIRLLLELGASIEILDTQGRDVFHAAVTLGHPSPEALATLLDITIAGAADIEKRDVHRQLLNQADKYYQTPLVAAICFKQTQQALLLLQYDCDVNHPFPTQSPLLMAIQSCEHELIKLLLANGARADAVDSVGMGILHYAGGIGDHETLLILLEHEPLIAHPVLVNQDGHTPMQNFESDRKMVVPEDELLYAESRKLFEALLNKANLY